MHHCATSSEKKTRSERERAREDDPDHVLAAEEGTGDGVSPTQSKQNSGGDPFTSRERTRTYLR